jgi:hypothetical protein
MYIFWLPLAGNPGAGAPGCLSRKGIISCFMSYLILYTAFRKFEALKILNYYKIHNGMY